MWIDVFPCAIQFTCVTMHPQFNTVLLLAENI
jgi:hypothetical protein